MQNILQLKIVTALQDKLSAPMRRITGASGKGGQAIADLNRKLKTLEQTQKTVGQFRELVSGMRATGVLMRETQARIVQLAGAMAQTQAPTKAMQREFKQVTAVAAKLKQTHQQQSLRLQELRDKLSAAGISTRTLSSAEAGLRGNITRTTDALRAQTAQLEKNEARQRKMAAAREHLNKGMLRTGAVAGVGLGARMAGMNVGRKMAGLLHVGYDFEKQMSAVQAVTRIDSQDDPRFQALKQQALTLPLSSKFTDLEVAQGQFFLGRTGYTPEQIMAAMPAMLNLAAAGDLDLATTADIASNIQTAMNIPRDQMQRVADVLAAMFTRNNVDIEMMGQSLKYSAVVGKEFGQSFETVAAATALLGNAGIQADMAGTTMRQILLRIGGSKHMKKLGIKTHDEKGNLRQLTDLLVEVGKVTGTMGNVLRGELFKDIADQRAVASFSSLVEQAQTGELQKMIAVAHNSQGEAAALAEIQMGNLAGELNLLNTAWQTISVNLFDQNKEWLRDMVKWLHGLVEELGVFLKENPKLGRAFIVLGVAFSALAMIGGSVLAALAPLILSYYALGFAGKMLGVKLSIVSAIFRNGGKVFKWLGRNVLPMVIKGIKYLARVLMMTPLGRIITAIAIAAGLIYRYWSPIKEFFGDLWGVIKNIFRNAWNAIKNMVETAWDGLSGFFRGVWREIQAAFDGGILGVAALLLNWSPLGLFHRAFAEVMSWFGIEIPKKFTDFGEMMIDGLIAGIKNMGAKLKETFLDILPDAPDWMKSVGAGIGNAASSVTDAAASASAPVLAFDTSPPIAGTHATRANVQAHTHVQASTGGDHINIHIHAAPGMPAQDIARAVSAELDRRAREKATRARSSLWDTF